MIITPQTLETVRADNPEASVALRFGCYDLLHEGHREGLQFAAEQADILVVGILPDQMVRRQKGPERPINAAFARAARIDSASLVDYTFIAPGSALDIAQSIRRLRPDIYVEHSEHGQSNIRRLYLGLLGVRYLIEDAEKINSTTEMLSRYGKQAAMQYSENLDIA